MINNRKEIYKLGRMVEVFKAVFKWIYETVVISIIPTMGMAIVFFIAGLNIKIIDFVSDFTLISFSVAASTLFFTKDNSRFLSRFTSRVMEAIVTIFLVIWIFCYLGLFNDAIISRPIMSHIEKNKGVLCVILIVIFITIIVNICIVFLINDIRYKNRIDKESKENININFEEDRGFIDEEGNRG